MRTANRSQFGEDPEKKGRSPLAFRFSKTKQKEVKKASPFTEMPEELKDRPLTLGGLLRKVFNSLLLIALTATLLALIAAFAYQLINDPEALAAASYNLVSTMQNLIQSLFPTG